jgi:hypothetical protein
MVGQQLPTSTGSPHSNYSVNISESLRQTIAAMVKAFG